MNVPYKNIGKFIANGLLNVILIATFISVFFFTYAARIERQIVEDQMVHVIKELMSDLVILPSEQKEVLRNFINNIPEIDMKEADALISAHNSALLKKAIMFCGIGIAVVSFIVTLLWYFCDFSLKEMCCKASIALLFVALTEFIFLTFLARRFRSADSNYVKLMLLENIEKM